MNRRAMMENYNYWGDSRVIASMIRSCYSVKSAGPNTMIIKIDLDYLDLPEGTKDTYEVSTRLCVCSTCSGSGKTVSPSIDAGGLSDDDFFEDPDFAEDYFGGTYDITCPTCKGEKVLPDEDEALQNLPQEIFQAIIEFNKDEADHAALSAAERRMGA